MGVTGSDLTRQEGGRDLTEFRPEETKEKDAKLKAVIAVAKELKDWPLLEKAVDHQIKLQKKHIAWWDASVRDAGRPKINAERHYLSVPDAEKKTEIKQYQVSRWKNWLEDEKKYRERVKGAAYAKAMGLSTGDEHTSDSSYEWYTPEKIIEAARKLMGGIDLDPASNDEAQKIVQATTYYTPKENGLAQNWSGRVWLNPPYCMPEVRQFINKLLEHHCSEGEVSEAVVLTNNATDTGWFHDLLIAAGTVCFTRGRVPFWGPHSSEAGARQGQAIFYLGDKDGEFSNLFSEFGVVLRV